MAFCKYCGQPVADQAAFCGACGKQLTAPTQPVAAPAQPMAAPRKLAYGAAPVPKKPNWILLGGIAAAVVAVIVVIILLVGGGSSPEKAFENMWDATYEGDTGAIHDMVPGSCWTYVAQRYGATEQMISTKIMQQFSEQKAQMQMLGMEYDWEIINTIEANEAQLLQVRQEVMEEYPFIAPTSITAASAMNVQISRGLEIDTNTMTAVEIDGNWYLLDGLELIMDFAEDFE